MSKKLVYSDKYLYASMTLALTVIGALVIGIAAVAGTCMP
jgi:hypothetical protein